MKKLVIAIGGNALQEKGSIPTSEAAVKVIKKTVKYISKIIEGKYKVVIVHGNGPQIGRIIIQNEYSAKVTPAMPFDVCGAMSQGMIGYHLQQAFNSEFRKNKLKKECLSVITEVVVDAKDKSFKIPLKPIGPFYTKKESDKLKKSKGYSMMKDSHRGYRRVVASPVPLEVVQMNSVKTLLRAGKLPITCGGGGVPVIRKKNGDLEGVPAVIDKDLAAELVAKEIGADTLLILTSVDCVYLNFGKKNRICLKKISSEEARFHLDSGEFGKGSMAPKIRAAIKFVESGKGRKCIIAKLDSGKKALEGKSGTIIYRK